jgi:Zn-dependent protease
MEEIYVKLFIYIVIVISAVFHEYAHGWMAYELGDDTAKRAGRLTLNPLAHLDLLGTVIVPFLSLSGSGAFIGWAKPVPFNPFALSDKKRGVMKVALAGPLANFGIALLLGLFLRFFALSGGLSIFFGLLLFVVRVNIFLALFNLLPLPPLDGSKVLAGLVSSRRFAVSRFLESMGLFGLILAFLIAGLILSPLTNGLLRIIIGPALQSL